MPPASSPHLRQRMPIERIGCDAQGVEGWRLAAILPRTPGQISGNAAVRQLSNGSLFEILAAWGAAGIAGQKAEHEDPDEEEDDRVNRDLEGEHGRACESGWSLSLGSEGQMAHPMGPGRPSKDARAPRGALV